MDATSIGALGAILISLVTAVLTFHQNGRVQRDSRDIDSRKVEGEDFDRITREQRVMIEDLRTQGVRQQAQIDTLRVEVANCEADKDLLRRKVVQLSEQIEGR